MPIQILARVVRPHLNPSRRGVEDFGARDLLGAAAVLVATVGFGWLVLRDLHAATAPTVGPSPDKPGPRPDPVFPTNIETKNVSVGMRFPVIGGNDPHPYPYFYNADVDVDVSKTGRMTIDSAIPVDVEVSVSIAPGTVINSPDLQYAAIINDVSFASSTKLVGAEILDGRYGVSPKMKFRIYDPPPNAPAILLQVQYSWTTQGGDMQSDTVSLGIFVKKT